MHALRGPAGGYGTAEEFHQTRRGALVDNWLFGRQHVRTKVFTVVDDLAGGPLDALAGPTGTWLDDPFGLEELQELEEDAP